MPAVPARPAQTARTGWGDRLRDVVGAYLPLLLMALLAVGTWWLAQHTPGAPTPETPRALTHEPDYTMQDFTLQRFAADGRLRVRIEGRQLRHYPDDDTIEIDDVRIRALAADGGVTLATARRAKANGAGTEVELLGAAEVVREADARGPAVTFRGEYLKAFLDAERLESHLPVVLQRAGDEIRAQGLEYDHRARIAMMRGPMRATLQAQAR